MNNNDPGTVRGADRFDQIEALLKSYPHISDGQVDDLKTWWEKEASAFDIASLASKDYLKEGYSRFRAEHIDCFKPKDVIVGILGLLGIVAVIAAIGFLWT